MGDRHSKNSKWGRVGRGRQLRTFFDASPDSLLAVRTVCCAPSSPGRRGGGARVLLAVCSETVASQTHGRVGRRAQDAIIGSALCYLRYQGVYLWTRGFTSGGGVILFCSIPTA